MAKSSAKKECPSCAMQVDADATICPVCEFEFPVEKRWRKWMAVLIIVLLVLVFVQRFLRSI